MAVAARPESSPPEASIVARWQQAGKPRDPQWLRAVGRALEDRQQFQNAIVIYCWLDDAPRVLECLREFAPEDVSLVLLARVLQYFLQRAHWPQLVRALDLYFTSQPPAAVPRQLCYDVTDGLARSALSPVDLDRPQREQLYAFLRECVLAVVGWSQAIPISRVGIAIEKTGRLREALEFYRDFVEAGDPRLRHLARTRWLAIRKKQAIYCRKEERLEKALEVETEVRQRARDWQIRLAEVPLKIPTASRQDALRPWQVSQPPAPAAGQPPPTDPTSGKAKVEVSSESGSAFTFQVRHVRIQVMAGKQILIVDTLSQEKLQIDGQSLQLRFGAMTVNACGGDSLAFGDIAGSYSGAFYHEKKPPELHLNVQGVADTIVLTL